MAEANEISESMKSAHIEDKNINILLLGTTGVGKSTFINSIANYLSFENFEVAKEEKLNVLIPCTFKIRDKDQKEQTVKRAINASNRSITTMARITTTTPTKGSGVAIMVPEIDTITTVKSDFGFIFSR
ncbi:unnamed protein product [Callosobruchus maculatus]|uniref:ATPase AAA-type core domain-containing protein n=1 Tax=Callosobruchus maculatus TaxID=64391 RepID=A0A653DV68_CALMS|nr:unnamed protein product [Callosobruchus maculatus]